MRHSETVHRIGGGSLAAIAVGLVGVGLAIRHLWTAVLAVLIGGAVYYLFTPLVSALARRRIPRLVSTLALAAAVLGAAAFALTRVVPIAYAQLEELVSALPYQLGRVERWLSDRGLSGAGADPRVRAVAESLLGRSDEVISQVANRVLGAVPGFFGTVVTVLLGLVTGVYLLLGGARLASGIAGWIPPGRREQWVRFGHAASRVLSGYLRARALASMFIGLSYWIAFALLGVDQAVLLAVIGGLFNLVPMIGPLLAAIPAITVAAFESWGLVLGVVVVQLVAQQIESSVIGPLIEGRAVRLPPAVVVLVVVGGSAVAGVAGMLLAVPVAGVTRAALEVFYRETWDERAA